MRRSGKHASSGCDRETHKHAPAASLREQLYRAAPLAVTGAIVTGAAHEINNPLTAVLGFSSALLARIGTNDEIDRKELASYLQIIHDEAIRCRDTVDRLHRFARDNGERGGGGASMLECVANALRLVSAKAARAEITLVNEFGADRSVPADRARLEQVLVALFMNRIGCCGTGTTITVSGPDVESAPSGTVAVMVSDNDAASLNAGDVTDDFFASGRQGESVCVGLGFCRRAVEEMGGRFAVRRGKGKGTSIRLEIPADAGTESRGNA
ncbi:MAG: HAMP domain-containing histidine kinase [Chitinispirillaceae bacterium]|nr:HAMP domain-containing histidine kinase [Chitinispirillaceae bacterium]